MHPRQFSHTHAQYVQRRLASLAVNVYVFFSSSIPIAVIHALNINRFMWKRFFFLVQIVRECDWVWLFAV